MYEDKIGWHKYVFFPYESFTVSATTRHGTSDYYCFEGEGSLKEKYRELIDSFHRYGVSGDNDPDIGWERVVIPVGIDFGEWERIEREVADAARNCADKAQWLACVEKCKKEAALLKLNAACDFIEAFMESGHKLVVYVARMEILEKLRERFPGAAIARGEWKDYGDWEAWDIPENQREINREIERFNNDLDCRLLIAAIQDIAVDLHLKEPCETLTLELGITPAENLEAERRSCESPHSLSPLAYYMIVDGTIENEVMGIVEREAGEPRLSGMNLNRQGLPVLRELRELYRKAAPAFDEDKRLRSEG